MIIDAHIHCYDPTRPEGVPWPPKDIPELYRTHLPEDYVAVAAGLGVEGAIIVEASEWLEDNDWILAVADQHDVIVGVMGSLDIGDPDFESHVARLATNPLFRGIRLRGDHLSKPDLMTLIHGGQCLAEHGLTLDLPIDKEGAASCSRLSTAVPDLRIVINHIGMVRIDGGTPDPEWHRAMRVAAKGENVFCKMSGMVSMAARKPAVERIEFYRPTLDKLWEVFGEDRLIYGSDWPACKIWADYGPVQGIAAAYLSGKSEEAAAKVWWRNSKTAYQWIDRSA